MLKMLGRAVLQEFLDSDLYVFHGSQNGKLPDLKPQLGDSNRYDTIKNTVSKSENLLYATTDIDVAIFIATIWRRVGASGFTTNGINEAEVSFEFHASIEAKAEAAKPDTIGFVYVLNKAQFVHDLHNKYEMVTSNTIVPYAIVAVTAYDLRPNFKSLSDPPSMT